MKKWVSAILLAILVLGGAWWVKSANPENQLVVEVSENSEKKPVMVVLDFGDGRADLQVEWLEKMNVLGALQQAVGDKHKVSVTKYDFGSLVTGIDGKENSAEKSWIYFVNGVSGDVGADQKIVNHGDVVEWKYIKPIF